MTLLLIAFLSGILTVLAPCVLPLLPIILWASAEDGNNKRIPIVIIGSLSVSIILFSLLLKVSTVLIGVPPSFWKSFSWGMIIALGVITVFPNLWKNISSKLWFSGNSNELLQKSTQKNWMIKYMFMGFALGPVFSSCSPTYALILAIILPAGFFFGLIALISYTLWLAAILFAIAIFGQKLIKNLKWASDPNGMFKKILWFIFILVGLAIISGYDKKIEAAVLDAWFLNTTNFEQKVINELELNEVKEESTELKKNDNNIELTGQKCEDGTCGKQIEWSLDFLNPDTLLEKWKVTQKWYKAPEFIGLTNWINHPWYENLDELKWKVVMIDFWTLGCINCINTHKETNKLYDEFKDQGLEIIWLHAPEFSYERKLENLKKSVKEFEMQFPIAQDNDFKTWKMYNNRYWPAFYIIDKNWYVRYTHFWEWGYDKKRKAIQELLAEIQSLPLNSLSPTEREAAASLLPGGEKWGGGVVKTEQAFSWDNLLTNTARSSIDTNLILSGGPGKDGIPSINNPKFISQQEASKTSSYLWEDDLGIVVSRGEEARFYGYDVLVWHEIVNDEIAGEKLSITFCPLCGSAIVYDRWNVNGQEVKFWVSGKLYNSNLLMYDSHDETLWSQSLGKAVVGDQLGTKLQVVASDLMNYSEFQKNFPNGTVLSNDTGYSRKYGQIPYGNYDTSDDLYFPVEGDDDIRFHSKKLFYIINDGEQSLAFAWDDLREKWEAQISLWDNVYIATFSEGLADVTKDWVKFPWYFEMWFSWINHNQGNKNIWSQ